MESDSEPEDLEGRRQRYEELPVSLQTGQMPPGRIDLRRLSGRFTRRNARRERSGERPLGQALMTVPQAGPSHKSKPPKPSEPSTSRQKPPNRPKPSSSKPKPPNRPPPPTPKPRPPSPYAPIPMKLPAVMTLAALGTLLHRGTTESRYYIDPEAQILSGSALRMGIVSGRYLAGLNVDMGPGALSPPSAQEPAEDPFAYVAEETAKMQKQIEEATFDRVDSEVEELRQFMAELQDYKLNKEKYDRRDKKGDDDKGSMGQLTDKIRW